MKMNSQAEATKSLQHSFRDNPIPILDSNGLNYCAE